MTDTITLKPPSRDLYAAVQVEQADGQILGATPAFQVKFRPTGRMIEVTDDDGATTLVPEMESYMVPLTAVTVTVKPGVPATARWVHENTSRGQTLTAIRGKGRWN